MFCVVSSISIRINSHLHFIQIKNPNAKGTLWKAELDFTVADWLVQVGTNEVKSTESMWCKGRINREEAGM